MRDALKEYKDLRDFLSGWYNREQLKQIEECWMNFLESGAHPGFRNIWDHFEDEIRERGVVFRGDVDAESIYSRWCQLTGFVIQDLVEKILYESEKEADA